MNRLDQFPNEALVGQYRQVFSTENGQDVLLHILYDLGMFVEITDGIEDLALNNYGTRLLQILSGGDFNENSMKVFIKQIMKQPLEKKHNDNT